MSEKKSARKLSLFDVTNLVIGAIIGADIYVASSFGAGFLGPFSLVVWVVAGFIAIVIALCFAQCAMMLPKVGGPYAYATRVWGPFAGFIVGWSLWLAEWVSLAVFPLAFTRYLMFFIPSLDVLSQSLVKVVFVAFLAVTNIVGVRAAGRVNDILTLLKLAPLVFFVVAGLGWIALSPNVAAANFSPFAPFGFAGFGSAIVLIFWAYAGFEISTIPAEDVEQPSKTIPKAIIIGVLVVTVFYLTTNAVLFGVRNYAQLATDSAPLAAASNGILSSNVTLALFGGLLVGVGALISVAGSDESGMIGTARLGYALAADGLFPKIFAKIHSKFKTPYASVVIQSVTALAAALLAPLFGGLGLLISVSVFFLAVAYLATSAAVFPLRKKNPASNAVYLKWKLAIPVLGIFFSVYLITQCSLSQIAIGVFLLMVGIPIYIKYSPKKELAEAKQALLSPQNILRRVYRQEQVFLAHVFFHIGEYYRRLTRKLKKNTS
ncbi:MAG TPA: APC family permease [Candidatus Binatia bacterium]|nr:APC family permease [Candidatus Binatia bacterium]